ncbi:MAG: hypothetical protein ACLRWM_10900 [Streptococcus sp.]
MNRAGVQVVMVTGDRKETAVAIAKEAGIVTGENDLVLTHDELLPSQIKNINNNFLT